MSTRWIRKLRDIWQVCLFHMYNFVLCFLYILYVLPSYAYDYAYAYPYAYQQRTPVEKTSNTTARINPIRNIGKNTHFWVSYLFEIFTKCFMGGGGRALLEIAVPETVFYCLHLYGLTEQEQKVICHYKIIVYFRKTSSRSISYSNTPVRGRCSFSFSLRTRTILLNICVLLYHSCQLFSSISFPTRHTSKINNK